MIKNFEGSIEDRVKSLVNEDSHAKRALEEILYKNPKTSELIVYIFDQRNIRGENITKLWEEVCKKDNAKFWAVFLKLM